MAGISNSRDEMVVYVPYGSIEFQKNIGVG